MKEQQIDLYDVILTYDRGNSTFKPDQMVTGTIKLMHKTSDSFKVDIASLVLKPTGKIAPNNKQNNKRIENILKEISPINMLQVEPIELAKNKTL